MVISLADVIMLLHRLQKLHLCLNPDIILIRFDKQGIPRLTLLDLGVADMPQNINKSWKPAFCPPSYTAPELIKMDGKIGSATDIYGLGLLLYELLAGRPAYPVGQLKDEEIYANVREGKFLPNGRLDIKDVPNLAEKAINRNYAIRPADIIQFAGQLQSSFPVIPKEKKGFKVNWRSVGIVIGAALAISLILLFAIVNLPK
jgi:serine/threonine protein kinase